MSNPISVNQRLLESRTEETKNGYLVVKYPRSQCSKNRAWQHLISKPPQVIGKRKIKKNNPWEKNHHGEFWSWSAKLISVQDIVK